MRTTVTLDPQVEVLLRKAMQASGQSFKQVLNNAVRKGLADLEADLAEPAFEVRARPMQLRTGLDPVQLSAMADESEIDAHRDLTQRLLDDAVTTRSGR